MTYFSDIMKDLRLAAALFYRTEKGLERDCNENTKREELRKRVMRLVSNKESLVKRNINEDTMCWWQISVTIHERVLTSMRELIATTQTITFDSEILLELLCRIRCNSFEIIGTKSCVLYHLSHLTNPSTTSQEAKEER